MKTDKWCLLDLPASFRFTRHRDRFTVMEIDFRRIDRHLESAFHVTWCAHARGLNGGRVRNDETERDHDVNRD